MRISVIGAGNGGHAISGYLAMIGHEVTLFERESRIVAEIHVRGGIRLEGKITGFGKLKSVTSNLCEAICNSEIIMIVTTASAHRFLALQMASYLEDGQVVILNPGRTGGALEFRHALREAGFLKRIYLAEAQTLIYACRLIEIGIVNIIGIKDKVFLSALPCGDTDYVLNKLEYLYKCFIPSKNVLFTSFENIGAVFHPCVILFNAAAIERGSKFYFYREMTPSVSEFIEQFDLERITVGKAYGVDLISATEWVSYAYENITGETLCEKMRNNPAYYDILAPTSINCRQMTEDIPTGVLPLIEFGKIAKLKMPLFTSLLNVSSSLLKRDFIKEGRTLSKLGMGCCSSVQDVLNLL